MKSLLKLLHRGKEGDKSPHGETRELSVDAFIWGIDRLSKTGTTTVRIAEGTSLRGGEESFCGSAARFLARKFPLATNIRVRREHDTLVISHTRPKK